MLLVSDEDHEQAHRCPDCGTRVSKRYFVDEADFEAFCLAKEAEMPEKQRELMARARKLEDKVKKHEIHPMLAMFELFDLMIERERL